MATLQELLARVEAASGPDRALEAQIICAINGWVLEGWSNDLRPGAYIYSWQGRRYHSRAEDHPPITASLDAALALVERVLDEGDDAYQAMLEALRDERRLFGQLMSKALPLALLAALLRALIAKEEP